MGVFQRPDVVYYASGGFSESSGGDGTEIEGGCRVFDKKMKRIYIVVFLVPRHTGAVSHGKPS